MKFERLYEGIRAAGTDAARTVRRAAIVGAILGGALVISAGTSLVLVGYLIGRSA